MCGYFWHTYRSGLAIPLQVCEPAFPMANVTRPTPSGEKDASPAPERARRTLLRGVLVFRWVSLAWMSVIALTDGNDFRRGWLAWASIGLAGAWTAWLSVPSERWERTTLWLDLGICFWLLVVSGLVVFDGEVVSGRAFFATGYPISSALTWGVRYGPPGGLVAGGLLGIGLILARPLNGVPLDELDAGEIRSLIGAIINYLVAGGAVGIVSLLLVRSNEALQEATDELVAERERAARLAERESLARQIHDSALQALALIHKKGRELARMDPIPSTEVGQLGELAGKEEAELRGLILRDPQPEPPGFLSLRSEIESIAREADDIDASVGSVGPVWIDREMGLELAAAVRQALANVVKHGHATKATLFAEQEAGRLIVSVRDDGVGFIFDEDALRAAGKVGILKSMKGRVEDIGGSMTVTSSPGKGTEIEFVVPLEGP